MHESELLVGCLHVTKSIGGSLQWPEETILLCVCVICVDHGLCNRNQSGVLIVDLGCNKSLTSVRKA